MIRIHNVGRVGVYNIDLTLLGCLGSMLPIEIIRRAALGYMIPIDLSLLVGLGSIMLISYWAG